jgi:ADP-ribose pyrophosphatase YjhB (NUDIX family)
MSMDGFEMPPFSQSRKNLGPWIPDKLWSQVKRYMSIPCVDVLLENPRGEILLGWRQIPPYKDVWALPGGRVGKGEQLQTTARRILAEYGLAAREFYLVGIFPMKFPTRSDFPVCVAARYPRGEASPDYMEFSTFHWIRQLPKGLGANYRRMIAQWSKIKSKPEILRFNRL